MIVSIFRSGNLRYPVAYKLTTGYVKIWLKNPIEFLNALMTGLYSFMIVN